ncbi:MAG: UbiA family prenyltransferase [Oscillochloridaceae bacterium]|nr:UbiA family prenyltransferase [Chloroflexaceae bacterium]MDW8390543.1 UbiA family prenyltransferase [Oscillochloridaceae bacterium]
MHAPASFHTAFRLRWLEAARSEAVLHWKFNRYDVAATFIPGLLFVLAAWHVGQADWMALPSTLLWGALYFWLYCSVFCISNQLAGEHEDRLNKPDRPLPSGLVTRRGAWARWFVVMGLFALAGWRLGVLEWALLWQTVLTLHNQGGWSRHYATKNLAMVLGAIAQLAAAWQMVRPLTPTAWDWILVLALPLLTHVSLQDLRDVAGDRAVGRRTLPIVFGEWPSRLFLAGAFAALPLATHFVLLAPLGPRPDVVALDVLLAAFCLVIAGRILWLRYPAADHRTYMLYNYWYCFTLAAAIVVL